MAPVWTTNRDHVPDDASPVPMDPEPPPRTASPPITSDGSAANRPVHKSVSFQDEVTPQEEGVTPEDGSRHVQVHRETKRENIGMALSSRDLLFCQSKDMGKAAGGVGRKGKSDAAKRDAEDTPPKWRKEQKGNRDNDINEEIEVPENPYKL